MPDSPPTNSHEGAEAFLAQLRWPITLDREATFRLKQLHHLIPKSPKGVEEAVGRVLMEMFREDPTRLLAVEKVRQLVGIKLVGIIGVGLYLSWILMADFNVHLSSETNVILSSEQLTTPSTLTLIGLALFGRRQIKALKFGNSLIESQE